MNISIARSCQLIGLSLVVLSATANSQAQTNFPTHNVNSVGYARLDAATGKITRGRNTDKAAVLGAAFTNTDTSGFFAGGTLVSAMGNPTEWLDWGLLDAPGTGSGIVGEFDFGYATTVLDLNNGGTTGAQVTVAFYDGALGNCVDVGTAPTASFSFTGLPGVTTGGAKAWVITVDLTGGLEFCLGGAGAPFGFSISSMDDDGTNGWATGPLLCQAGDGLGGPDANGQVDLFDIYDGGVEAGACMGSFFFGGPPNDFSSWYLAIRTADVGLSDAATCVSRNGSGINPNNFTVTNNFVLNEDFTATDLSTNGGSAVFMVGYLQPLTFPTIFGEILCNIADPSGELFQAIGCAGPFPFDLSGTANITCPVPKDLTLVGIGLCTQTVELFPGVQLHNANDCVIGL